MKLPLASLLLVVMTAAQAQAQDSQGPEANRSGFTANLNIGVGITNIAPKEGDGDTKVGLAGINVDLGAYLVSNLALVFRISGTNFSEDVGDSSEQFLHAFYGVAAQFWLDDKISVGGGAGVGVFGPSPLGDVDIDPETGLALNARASYRFAGGWHGSLDVSPGFYDSGTTTGVSLLVGYQWD